MMDKTFNIVAVASIVFFIINTGAFECPEEEDDTLYSAERKLRKTLLCNYDTDVRPVKDQSKSVNVSMSLFLKHIQTQEEQQNGDTITVHTWMSLQWDDEYLEWNISDHSNITVTRLYSYEIWNPQIVAYNSDTSHVAGAYQFSADCLIYYSGMVMCLFHAGLEATCDMDLSRWPYDTQNCTLSFKNVIFKSSSVNIAPIFTKQEDLLKHYRPNRYWQLNSVNVSRLPGDFPKISNPTITYSLILKRHAASRSALIIVPAIVMIVITIASIMMKVSTSQRMYMLAVNILCHFLYLENLSYYAPSHGDTCPLVVIFYRDSLVVTAIVLFTTAALKMLIGRRNSVPKWIDNVIAVANTTPGQLVMYASDDADDLDRIVSDNTTDLAEKAEQRQFQDWKNFVKIINRLLLLTVIITYFGLFVAMIVF